MTPGSILVSRPLVEPRNARCHGPGCFWKKGPCNKLYSILVVEDESHHHVHAELGDCATIHFHRLFLDPGAFDVRSVFDARSMPLATASSKLFVEVAAISDTRATVMISSFAGFLRLRVVMKYHIASAT